MGTYNLSETIHNWVSLQKQPGLRLKSDADFNLSGDCCGTDIVPNYTKWPSIGLHGMNIGQISAKSQCFFFIRNNTSTVQKRFDALK